MKKLSNKLSKKQADFWMKKESWTPREACCLIMLERDPRDYTPTDSELMCFLAKIKEGQQAKDVESLG